MKGLKGKMFKNVAFDAIWFLATSFLALDSDGASRRSIGTAITRRKKNCIPRQKSRFTFIIVPVSLSKSMESLLSDVKNSYIKIITEKV